MATTAEIALARMLLENSLQIRRELIELNERINTIMATDIELEAKIDALAAGQAEAKADAARHEARTNTAIGFIQDLKQAIADLQAQGPALITQEKLDALVNKADAALSDMNAANVQRDAADEALGGASA